MSRSVVVGAVLAVCAGAAAAVAGVFTHAEVTETDPDHIVITEMCDAWGARVRIVSGRGPAEVTISPDEECQAQARARYTVE